MKEKKEKSDKKTNPETTFIFGDRTYGLDDMMLSFEERETLIKANVYKPVSPETRAFITKEAKAERVQLDKDMLSLAESSIMEERKTNKKPTEEELWDWVGQWTNYGGPMGTDDILEREYLRLKAEAESDAAFGDILAIEDDMKMLDGELVSDGFRCAFCGRNPRPGEKFGTGKKDWDANGIICPDCWRDTLPPE